MLTARQQIAAGVVNGVLYVVGGDGGSGILATVEAYDPVTNTWNTKALMPAPRYLLGAGVVDGILYAIGGHDGTNIVATNEAFTPPGEVLWSSSDTNVATMDQTGLATGLSSGQTTITATSGSISGNTTLTVLPDNDSDGIPDATDPDDDNDGFNDAAETAAGSDPFNAISTPGVCDGLDNEPDGLVDEGFPNTDGDSQADCVDPDDDNDGVSDAADQCPLISGTVGGTGCPAADKNTVTLHTVNLRGGTSVKAPLAGAEVRVFDRNSSAFQTVAGSKNPDGSLYGVIFEADAGRIATCTTDSTGICFAGEVMVGDYLAVVRHVDPATGKTVYVGRPKSPSDFVDTNGDGIGDMATKDFQVMKVFKNGVLQGYRGGSKLIVTGSILEMIVPESAVWEGTQSIYPFIFTSDSTWTVNVCAEVPVGYAIVGVYNEAGELVASKDCVQTLVASEMKAIAFEVIETSSPEPSLTTTLTVKSPKGKTTVKQVTASDIRKATFEAELKKAKSKKRRN